MKRIETRIIDPTPIGAAMRAYRMHAEALVGLKNELEQTYKSGTAEQRSNLRTRIASMQKEVDFRNNEIKRLSGPDDPEARRKGMKLIEARQRQLNAERASRGLPALNYETTRIG
jgi:hypothetical protein